MLILNLILDNIIYYLSNYFELVKHENESISKFLKHKIEFLEREGLGVNKDSKLPDVLNSFFESSETSVIKTKEFDLYANSSLSKIIIKK